MPCVREIPLVEDMREILSECMVIRRLAEGTAIRIPASKTILKIEDMAYKYIRMFNETVDNQTTNTVVNQHTDTVGV